MRDRVRARTSNSILLLGRRIVLWRAQNAESRGLCRSSKPWLRVLLILLLYNGLLALEMSERVVMSKFGISSQCVFAGLAVAIAISAPDRERPADP